MLAYGARESALGVNFSQLTGRARLVKTIYTFIQARLGSVLGAIPHPTPHPGAAAVAGPATKTREAGAAGCPRMGQRFLDTCSLPLRTRTICAAGREVALRVSLLLFLFHASLIGIADALDPKLMAEVFLTLCIS
jgi:hypothetical protein